MSAPSPGDAPAARPPLARALALLFIAQAAVALGLALLLELSLRLEAWQPLPWLPVLVGTAVLLSLLLGLTGMFGRPATAAVLMLTLTLVIASANALRIRTLAEPLTPTDFAYAASPAFLVEMLGWATFAAVALGVAAVGLVGTVVLRRRRWDQPPRIALTHPAAWRWVRLACVAQAVVTCWVASGFVDDDRNPLRALYAAAGVQWGQESPMATHLRAGFVGGFLATLPTDPMAPPEGYSRAAVEEVASEWIETTRTHNRGRDAAALARTNVVVVLSESFGDPALIPSVTPERDALAALRPLLASTTVGTTSGIYGSGTSRMEYQVLTGHSAELLQGPAFSPYQEFVADLDSHPSAVAWFTEQALSATALHTYSDAMYRRREVYPRLGFDAMRFDTELINSRPATEGGFISDASGYDEVLGLLDREPSQFVHLVTMQNHVPVGGHDAPLALDGVAERSSAEAAQWARGIEVTSEATRDFLDDVSKLEEPTLVVFYGDHYPGLFPEAARSHPDALRTLPFFIWHSEDETPVDLGHLGAPALLPAALGRIDAPVPPFLHFVEVFHREVGTIQQGHVITPQGDQVAFDELNDEQSQLLEQYRLLQYDLSIGERHVAEAMWTLP